MSARVFPQETGERSEDVMSNLLLASVNSATFSRTSALNHSSARHERRRSLELVNNDPVWDLKNLKEDELPERLSKSEGFQGGELLENEDSDVLSGLNTKEKYVALNASPTKNKKFIKTLDSKRLHEDRIRRNSEDRDLKNDVTSSAATEMKSEPIVITTQISTNSRDKVVKKKEPEEEEDATVMKEMHGEKEVEVVVKETEKEEEVVKEEEKQEKPSTSEETTCKELTDDKKPDPVAEPTRSNDDESSIQQGSTGDVEI